MTEDKFTNSQSYVDKILVQSKIDSIHDLVYNLWQEYSEYFSNSEKRIKHSLNNWILEFFEDWELTDLHWPYEITDIENGAEISGYRCHTERFNFSFQNNKLQNKISFSFTEHSSEWGIEPFQDLAFESMQIGIEIDSLSAEWSFEDIMLLSKTNDFIGFFNQNLETFRKILIDEYKFLERKCAEYGDDAEKLLENHFQSTKKLQEIERREKIQEFFKACNSELYFNPPRRIRITSNTTKIVKAIKVLRVHGNMKYIDVLLEELELGLLDEISFKSKSYKRVFIKTMFGFDLTNEESLQLLTNDL